MAADMMFVKDINTLAETVCGTPLEFVQVDTTALNSLDADAGDTFTYTLVPGTGDADNAIFEIIGTSLRAKSSFDFETNRAIPRGFVPPIKTDSSPKRFSSSPSTMSMKPRPM